MKYFGVPTCPYCKKRVNLIRTWSLKRQGEYRCPRCSGISNIYLSPLIYVIALLAVFAGGAVYFFHKFILDDISFSILLQVVVPFAVFFFLSLFMVYLEKPVIKKVPKAELNKRRRREQPMEDRRMQTGAQPLQYDAGDYLPREQIASGPMPSSPMPSSPRPDSPRLEPPTKLAPPKIQTKTPRPVPVQDELSHTSVVPRVRTTAPAQGTATQPQTARRTSPVVRPLESRPQVEVYTPENRPQATASVSTGDDFFAKYDDPDYVARRLKELGKTDDDSQ